MLIEQEVIMNIEFKAGTFSSKTESIYKRLVALYNKFEKTETIDKLSTDYVELAKEEKITVAFVGQYSSGKSTIIKALTGEKDILIDADIATGAVTPYEWGGSFLLVDTPGLKTGEKEEHDIMTMEAIEHSDLLVYCITSDLFSPITKRDFKQLAEKYRSKIFLMVNKMNAETGDYDDLVENYTDSINKTLAPEYSIIDFHHFFVDAKDYLTGITENDQDYIDDSFFTEFIVKLNEFIELRGLKGKLLTPISILLDSVENSLIEIETDDHIKEGKRLIKRICDVIEEKKRAFIKTANEDVQRTANKYIHKGDDVAMHLGEKGYEFNERAFQDFSEPIEDELRQNIQKYFEQYAEEVDDEVTKVMNSEMAQHFFEEHNRRLGKDFKGGNNKSERLSEIEKSVSHAANVATPKINAWIGKIANVSDGSKISIWTVNGSDLHKIVKDVGHKFGYKFKPFEALKIIKKIAEISKWIGPILTGIGVFVEGAMWLVEKFGEKKTKKVKMEIKTMFNEVAEDTLKHYNAQIASAASEFDTIKDSLQEELDKLDNESSRNDDFSKQLLSIKKELINLQHQIEE